MSGRGQVSQGGFSLVPTPTPCWLRPAPLACPRESPPPHQLHPSGNSACQAPRPGASFCHARGAEGEGPAESVSWNMLFRLSFSSCLPGEHEGAGASSERDQGWPHANPS